MNTILDQIILYSGSVSGSIDHAKLTKHTQVVSFRDVEAYGLGNIRQLYILSSADSLRQSLSLRTGVMGCHLNREYGWLLLIAPEAREREQVIAACSSALERLDIRFSDASELKLGHLSGLKTLKLRYNAQLRRIDGLKTLKYLDCLHVEYCGAFTDLDLSSLTFLRELWLSGDFETVRLDRALLQLQRCVIPESGLKQADFLRYMLNLEMLVLRNSPLSDLPDLRGLRELYYVDLENTRLSRAETLPGSVEQLNLSRTDLRQVPECVRSMEYLGVLKLDGLLLRELPLWLHELRLPVFVRREETDKEVKEGITLFGTRVESVDMYMIPAQRELLRGWLESYHAQMQDGERPINEIKVVFLGDGEAGKSLVVNRLMNGGKHPPEGTFCDDSTPGVAIYHETMPLEDRHMRIHYWDFGGQEILHAMHRIFQTHRTVYVVVLNARNDTQDERALYWLRSIRSFDGRTHENARILFVLNKTDQNPRASINMTALRLLQPDLPDPVMLSAKRYSPQEFNDTMGAALKREIQAMENLQAHYPASWYRVKLRLEEMGKDLMEISDFDDICDQEGVEDDETVRDRLADLLSTLGVIFRSGDGWAQYTMLLRPAWVTNAIYKLLFNKHEDARNGLISVRSLNRCICGENGRNDQYWSVLPEIRYKPDQVRYIMDVLNAHKLSFSAGQDYLIPMLCERNASAMLAEYADDPNVLEIWWRFEYLPQNVLFELMVKQAEKLDREHIWLSGARFVDADTGSSMIVSKEGDTLKIYIRSESPNDDAMTFYKGIEPQIRSCIHTQRQDRTLPYERFLVYKVNGRRELFDMDRLETGGRQGVSMFYSKIMNAAVPAQDILNCASRGADALRNKLIRDVLGACGLVQGMRIFWDSKDASRENARNSHIAGSLELLGYQVKDQTLCGESAGRNQEGELDLAIYKDTKTLWTIYEGLNLRSANLKYWNYHLDKLLENYNPHGLKFLLLVSYVHCSREKFLEIWGDYARHIPSYDPGKYCRIPNSYADISGDYVAEASLLKIAQCDYTCGENNTRVYHIFVHLGERKG